MADKMNKVESVTVLNDTESHLEILVAFNQSGKMFQRVVTVLAPGKSHKFSPTGKGNGNGSPPLVDTLFIGKFGSKEKANKFGDVGTTKDSSHLIYSIQVDEEVLKLNEINDDGKLDIASQGASPNKIILKNTTTSSYPVELSSGNNVKVGQSQETSIVLDSDALNSITLSTVASGTLVYVVMEDDVKEGETATFEIVAWPSVGLTIRPPLRCDNGKGSDGASSGAASTQSLSRAPLGGEAAKAGASKAKSGSGNANTRKKGKKGEDHRKPESSSEMDAFLPTSKAEEEEVAEPEVAPEPEAEQAEPEVEIPDDWDCDDDAASPPPIPITATDQAIAAGIPVDISNDVTQVPSKESSQIASPVPSAAAAPPVASVAKGGLRPGGSRALRPGGAKGGGAAGASAGGFKSGAGSFSGEFGEGAVSSVTIKHRYSKEELLSFKPPATAVFPTNLKLLPSYDVRAPTSTGGGGGGNTAGSNEQWGRNRSYSGGKGGGKGGGGQWERRQNAHMPQLTKSKNPFLIGNRKESKNAEDALEARIISILNKLTPQTYDKLLRQILELPIDRASSLKTLIRKIFDKVIGEAAFSEIYAKLCSDINDNATKVWSYVRIISDPLTGESYWVADVPNNASELVGPFPSAEKCYEMADEIVSGKVEAQTVRPPPGTNILFLQKRGDNLVKVYHCLPNAFYFSYDSFDTLNSLADQDLAGGPYKDKPEKGTKGSEEAYKKGVKATSLKRLLLNRCQEAFETDDIYAEIERKFNEGDPSKMTAVERAERIEEREMSTLKAKKQMLGNIRFVGELYKSPKMLQDKIMHFCIQKLLSVTNDSKDGNVLIDSNNMPYLHTITELSAADEDNIEALANLLSTIGAKLEKECSGDVFKSQLMNLYFLKLQEIATDKKFPSRIRFMLQDFFEMRANGYVPRRKEDKQMTQEQIRRIAAQDLNNNQQQQQQPNYGGGGGHQQQHQQHGGKGKGKGKGQQNYGGGNVAQNFGGGNNHQRQQKGDIRMQQANQGQGGGAYGGGRPQYQQQHNQQPVRTVMQRDGQQQHHQQQRQSAQQSPQPSTKPQVQGAVFDEDKVKDRLRSFISDWKISPDEDELVLTWDAYLSSFIGSSAGHDKESVRRKIAQMFADLIINKAVEEKPLNRASMVELVITLTKHQQLQSPDFLTPLKEFLEFLEDFLMDIPTLYANLAELLWSFVTNGLVELNYLELILKEFVKSGDPPMQPKTIHNFFNALASQLEAMESPLSVQARTIQERYA